MLQRIKKAPKKIKFVVLAGIIVLAAFAFKQEIKYWLKTISISNNDPCNQISYQIDSFDIQLLSPSDLPYVAHQKEYGRNEYYDRDSVPLVNLNDEHIYHPVYIAQYTLRLIDVFQTTSDSAVLKQIEIIAGKLISLSDMKYHARFFPYSIDYQNHPNHFHYHYAPWYSGMAQGQILSVFTRLYEITHTKKYLLFCNEIFHSLTLLKGKQYSPWVMCVDQNKYLWIEEYPSEKPCFTLNGMIFGIYGVYDYYRITKNPKAKEILQATLTTVKDNLHKYRNKNEPSYYCQVDKLKISEYHEIVVGQLFQLYKITKDPFFQQQAELFESDTK